MKFHADVIHCMLEKLQSVSTRLKKHVIYRTYENVKNSTVAERSSITKHDILFEGTKILTSIPFYLSRRMR